jgi:hypothetical protein
MPPSTYRSGEQREGNGDNFAGGFTKSWERFARENPDADMTTKVSTGAGLFVWYCITHFVVNQWTNA